MSVNMSHCRFHNTLAALRECMVTLDDGGLNPLDDLSEEERKCALKLIKLCGDFSASHEDLL